MSSNPAEVIELGARVLWELSNEEDSSMATRHYEDCPTPDADPELGCPFCYYGPYSDIKGLLQERIADKAWDHRPHLGDPWYF